MHQVFYRTFLRVFSLCAFMLVVNMSLANAADRPVLYEIGVQNFCARMNQVGESNNLLKMESASIADIQNDSCIIKMKYPFRSKVEAYSFFDSSESLYKLKVNAIDGTAYKSDSFLSAVDVVYEALRIVGMNHTEAFKAIQSATDSSVKSSSTWYGDRYYTVRIKNNGTTAVFELTASTP